MSAVPLEPLYQPGVDAELDIIEGDPERQVLWISIVKTLTMICDQPDGSDARRFAIRHPNGETIWRVPVPSGQEKENYSILWHRDGDDAVIHYVGVWPPPPK